MYKYKGSLFLVYYYTFTVGSPVQKFLGFGQQTLILVALVEVLISGTTSDSQKLFRSKDRATEINCF